jgi:N-acetylneuraminic acid mutarotase
VNGEVVVSVSDGQFFRYDGKNNIWETLAQQLDPGRFFHRVFAISDSAFAVVGGANMEIDKFREIAIVSFGDDPKNSALRTRK